MAKIYEESIVIKLSKLVKNDQQVESMTNDEILAALEQVVQELVGDSIVVEIDVK